jgi:hypothetical protein
MIKRETLSQNTELVPKCSIFKNKLTFIVIRCYSRTFIFVLVHCLFPCLEAKGFGGVC